MSVLFEAGQFNDCHYCDQSKPVLGGAAVTGYRGIILWYCADCYLSVLARTSA